MKNKLKILTTTVLIGILLFGCGIKKEKRVSYITTEPSNEQLLANSEVVNQFKEMDIALEKEQLQKLLPRYTQKYENWDAANLITYINALFNPRDQEKIQETILKLHYILETDSYGEERAQLLFLINLIESANEVVQDEQHYFELTKVKVTNLDVIGILDYGALLTFEYCQFDEESLKEINRKNGYDDIGGTDLYYDGKTSVSIALTANAGSSSFYELKRLMNQEE